jgi:hypothetical protein
MTTQFRQGTMLSESAESNRHFAYHSIVVAAVVASATTAVSLNGFSHSTGYHCHYTVGFVQNTFVVLPALVCVTAILVANLLSLRNIFTMLHQFTPSLSEQFDAEAGAVATVGSESALPLPPAPETDERWLSLNLCFCVCGGCLGSELETFLRLSKFSQRTVRRILLTQLNFILVFGTAFVIFGLGLSGVGTDVTLSLLLIVAPMNSLLWVYTDGRAVSYWRQRLCGGLLADGALRDDQSFVFSDDYGSSQASSPPQSSHARTSADAVPGRGSSVQMSHV